MENIKKINFLYGVCLSTKDLLNIKKVDYAENCLMCDREKETVWHLFLDYFFVKQCWNLFGFQLRNTQTNSIEGWFVHLSSSL